MFWVRVGGLGLVMLGSVRARIGGFCLVRLGKVRLGFAFKSVPSDRQTA